MVITICHDKQECGMLAAKFAAGKIRKAIAEQGECRIILATGASQFEMLSALLVEKDIDWSAVTMFHLDEYVGLPASHPASFRKYLTDRFVSRTPVPLKEVNFVNGEAGDLRAFCDRLGEHLQDKPVDVAFIGIGENGHIAFNEPMKEDEISVEEFGALPTRVLPLSPETIAQNTAVTADGDSSLVPRFAATMGMAPILAARRCLLLACFAEQQAPLRAIFARGGEPTPFLPASYLWRHPDFHLVYTRDKIALTVCQKR